MNCKINIQCSVYSTSVLNIYFKYSHYLDLFEEIQGQWYLFIDIQSSVYLHPAPNISKYV